MCNASFYANRDSSVYTNAIYVVGVFLFWRVWCVQEGLNDTVSVISSEEDFHSWNFSRVMEKVV